MKAAGEAAIDEMDKRLLNLIQAGLTLAPSPFREIGAGIGVEEGEVLSRLRRLKDMGVIRQISAIFDSAMLGYTSTLVAAKVPPERLDEVAAVVSAHPGVSHNYARDHAYNLWFTITLPPGHRLQEAVAELALRSGVKDFIVLPALRLFKIGVRLNMLGDEPAEAVDAGNGEAGPRQPVALSATDIRLIRALQKDLPVEPRPFAAAARELGVSEEDLLLGVRSLLVRRLMRRFAAVLRHRQAGFSANAMGAWVVPAEDIERVGKIMAGVQEVTHCYQRPRYPDWPYDLFTMIHGRSREECEDVARRISTMTGIHDYRLLYSTKEYKKTRVQYFEEDEDEVH